MRDARSIKDRYSPFLVYSVHVRHLWNRYDFIWDRVDPEVNILIGANGSGKSTLLRIIHGMLSGKTNAIRRPEVEAEIQLHLHEVNSSNPFPILHLSYRKGRAYVDGRAEKMPSLFGEVPVILLNTFDVDLRPRKGSVLDEMLQQLLYDGKPDALSLVNYRLRFSTLEEDAGALKENLYDFFKIVDGFLAVTEKQMVLEGNAVRFSCPGRDLIEVTDLSSGEKQLLILLLQVFLTEGKPYVLLLDEPEASLHITWQRQLIAALRQLNPHLQLFIATHSPSVFVQGWEDKIVYMEHIRQNSY